VKSHGTRLAVGAAVALALLGLFFRGLDWPALGAAFRRAHAGWMVAVVAVTLLTYAARAWRWGFLLAPLARVRFAHLLSATYVGFMTALVVPRAGEVVRPYLVGRRHGVPTSAAFASIVLERVVDLITVLVLFGSTLLLLPRGSMPATLFHSLEVGGALAAAAALGVLGALLALDLKAEASLRLLARVLAPLPKWLGEPVHRAVTSFAEGLGVLRSSPAHLAAIGAQSLLVWLCIALSIHCNNLAFGVHLPFVSTFVIIGFLTVGVAIPTPGAVGGFHVMYLLALTQVYGVDRETAAAAGLACHALTNLPVLAAGLLLLPGEGLSFGKVADMAEDKPEGSDHLLAESHP
jgi:glycosyltransferase 2 family protein